MALSGRGVIQPDGESKLMRIAIIGVGAVGGYFGGRLAETGHDVVFVARSRTLETLQTVGLRVESSLGDFSIAAPQVAFDPTGLAPADVVLVAVKAHQVREAARLAALLAGPSTTVIPLQNGVEAPVILGEVLGTDRVLGGLCKIFSTALGPGHIRHVGFEPAILFGELGRPNTERVARIREAFEAAKGMKVHTPDDVEAALWEKCLFVAPLGAIGAMTRQPAGVIRAVAETRRTLKAAMEEFAAVARGRGVGVAKDAVERSMKIVDGLPPEATASMQRDIADGRPSELKYQVGTVVRYGRECGVPIPVTETIYGALLPYELEARGKLEARLAAIS